MKTNLWISLANLIKKAWSYWAIRFVAVWRAPHAQPRSLRPFSLRLVVSMALIIGMAMSSTALVNAYTFEDEDKATIVVKHASGEVSTVRPTYISIVYDRGGAQNIEHEMVFFLNKELELKHVESLDELSMGDRIKVTYEERTWIEERFDQERVKRVATGIEFLRPAVTGLRSENRQNE